MPYTFILLCFGAFDLEWKIIGRNESVHALNFYIINTYIVHDLAQNVSLFFQKGIGKQKPTLDAIWTN